MITYTVLLKSDWDGARAERGLKRLQGETKKLKKGFKEAFEAGGGGAFAIRGIATEVENQVRGLTVALGVLTAAMTLLGRQAINMSAEFETLGVTLEVLTGSAGKADRLLRDLKEFAATTPLQLRDVEEGATILLGLGEAAEDVIPILKRLGEAAVVMQKPMEQFIRARNLLAQGVVLSRTLAPLGISRQTLAQFGAGAEATGRELVQAFDKALLRFEGLFERTFNTVRGRLSNLRDQMELTFAGIGDAMQPLIMGIAIGLEQAFTKTRIFLAENKELVEESFRLMFESGKTFLTPLIALLTRFVDTIAERPDLLPNVTRGFVAMTSALVGLVIVGHIAVGFLSLIAAITLLRIAWPQLVATMVGFGTIAKTFLVPASKALRDTLLALRFSVASLATGRMSQLVFLLKELGLMLGRVIPWVFGIVQAFKNWREILTATGSVFQAVTSFIQFLGDGIKWLGETVPVVGDAFMFLGEMLKALNLIITSVIVGIEGMFRGIDLLINKLRDLMGVTDAYKESLERWNDYLDRAEKSMNLFNETGVVSGEILKDLQVAIDGIDVSRAVGELKDLTSALWDTFSAATMMRLGALAVEAPLIGPPTGRAQALEEAGYSTEEIARMLGGAYEAERRESLQTMLRDLGLLPTEARGGGGGGRVEEILTGKEAFLDWLDPKGERGMVSVRLTEALNRLTESVTRETDERRTPRWPRVGDKWDPTEAVEAAKEARAMFPLRDKVWKEAIKLPDQFDTVFERFINNLAGTLGKFLENWGWKGGGLDVMGLLQRAVKPLTSAWGADIAGGLGMAGKAAGGMWGGLISGGIGFLANRLFGDEEPLMIEQPVDIRIVDIESRLLNFFSFRGMDPFTYSSSFRSAFENGLY